MAFLHHMNSFDGYLPSVVLVLVALLLICWRRLRIQLDPLEPPLLRSTIPFVGHLLGIVWWQHHYFQMLSERFPVPMFTLSILGSKVYVIADPQLAQVAMRGKTLTMDTFIKEVVPRLGGSSPKVVALLNSEDQAFMRDLHELIHTALLPGPNLDGINNAILAQLASSINKVGIGWETKPSLFEWIRQEFSCAVGRSLFGKNNPIERDVLQALWTFEESQMTFIMGLPKIVAQKALKARQVFSLALRDYYRREHDKDADVSWLIQTRARLLRNFELTSEEIAGLDLTLVSAATSNAGPILFWVLCYVLSDATLTEDIRAELATIITKENSTATVDFSKFQSHCPLLISVYLETQRLVIIQTGVRSVMSDTTLSAGGKSYLVKKDAVIQMPSSITHNSAAVWGADVNVFSARRFLKSEDRIGKAQKQAFIPFGGGKHLCPGRYFAFAGILGFVSAAVMGLELQGTDGTAFRMEEARVGKFGLAVQKPVGRGLEMGVRVRRRKGWEGVSWAFVGGNKEEVDLGA